MADSIIPTQPEHDFYALYQNQNLWQLHTAVVDSCRLPWMGTVNSQIVQTFASETGIMAALAGVDDMPAWGYNPASHRFILTDRCCELFKLCLGLPLGHNHWGAAAYTLQECWQARPWGNRPWETTLSRGDESLGIQVGVGPREQLFYRYPEQCVLVSVRYHRPGVDDEVVRFWLDSFLSATGSVLGKSYLDNFAGLEAVYQKLAPKRNAPSLLRYLSDNFGDIVLGLKSKIRLQQAFESGLRGHAYQLLRLVADGAMDKTRDALEKAGAAIGPEQVKQSSGRAWQCQPGCGGGFELYLANAVTVSGPFSRPFATASAEEAIRLFQKLGFGCSCQAVAMEAFTMELGRQFTPYRQDCSLPRAVAAGIRAELAAGTVA